MIIHPHLALRGVTTEIAFFISFYFFEKITLTATRPGIDIDSMALSIPPKTYVLNRSKTGCFENRVLVFLVQMMPQLV